MKDHLIQLPVRGEPDVFRIRFAGIRFTGSRDECAAVASAIRAKAEGIAGEAAVAAFQRAQYAEVWAPMLRRRTPPKYVPDWAHELHRQTAVTP
jgi:hypothetical protein